MENYFNYFTEIEEHFQRRRGTLSWLSPLDWALIESFQEAEIPLEVVLRGIDLAFDKHDRKGRIQRVNSLSYCTQTVLKEFERFREGSLGKNDRNEARPAESQTERQSLVEMLQRTLEQLRSVPDKVQAEGLLVPPGLFEQTAASLEAIRQEILQAETLNCQQLEVRLSMLEERILAALVAALGEDTLLALRTEVNQELNRHRRSLKAEQLAMLERKVMNKKLLERFGVPRLSLFYMPLN